jgi:anti-sigma B factor antagonist
MDFVRENAGAVTVLRAMGSRIDAAGAIQFKDRMRAACDGAARRIVLDLSQVDFLDSSGLGAIVAVRRLLGDAHVLELAALTPPVARVFRLTRMDTVFAIHARAQDAA